jgi:uncharacterized membrane protein YfcA
MTWLIDGLVSFFCAALSALGMGGGGILLIYLTAFMGMNQQEAQGINLVFFIPIALVAIFIHAKKGLIKWKMSLKCVLLGIIGVYFGSRLAMLLESDILSKFFGVFLLIIGIRELLSKPKKSGDSKNISKQ